MLLLEKIKAWGGGRGGKRECAEALNGLKVGDAGH